MEQKKQYELEEQQYRNLLSSTEKLRSIKHDILNSVTSGKCKYIYNQKK